MDLMKTSGFCVRVFIDCFCLSACGEAKSSAARPRESGSELPPSLAQSGAMKRGNPVGDGGKGSDPPGPPDLDPRGELGSRLALKVGAQKHSVNAMKTILPIKKFKLCQRQHPIRVTESLPVRRGRATGRSKDLTRRREAASLAAMSRIRLSAVDCCAASRCGDARALA